MRLLRSTGRSRPSASPFLTSQGPRSTATATRTPTPIPFRPTIAPSCCLPRRFFHSTSPRHREKNPAPDRIDKTPPTDISALDVLGSAPVPSTNIEATLPGGFLLNSGLGIFDGAGALLVGGEAFAWRPWLANASSAAGQGDENNYRLLNAKGQVELPAEAFSVLELLWPRPGMLLARARAPCLDHFQRSAKGSTKYLLLTLVCHGRSTSHWRRTYDPASEPRDETAHRRTGHAGGDSRHEERGVTV